MVPALESNFLIPNGTFLVALLVLLLVLAAVVVGVTCLVLALSRRDPAATDR